MSLFYYHDHELKHLQKERYGISSFVDLPDNPIVERVVPMKGRQVPLFKIERIAGTVLDRNKLKKTVTLLTDDAVVTVRIYGNIFTYYDKQISEKGADGKKHIIEKSLFTRGNKLIITGIKREDTFLAKKYKSTNYPLVELISEIYPDGTIETYRREGA